MTFRSEVAHSAAGTRPPRTPIQYVVVVEEHIEPKLAGRSPCLYISPPQLRTSAMALVGLLLSRSDDELGEGPWRMAIVGGERTIRMHRTCGRGQIALDL